jgi:hypothetical protein
MLLLHAVDKVPVLLALACSFRETPTPPVGSRDKLLLLEVLLDKSCDIVAGTHSDIDFGNNVPPTDPVPVGVAVVLLLKLLRATNLPANLG